MTLFLPIFRGYITARHQKEQHAYTCSSFKENRPTSMKENEASKLDSSRNLRGGRNPQEWQKYQNLKHGLSPPLKETQRGPLSNLGAPRVKREKILCPLEVIFGGGKLWCLAWSGQQTRGEQKNQQQSPPGGHKMNHSQNIHLTLSKREGLDIYDSCLYVCWSHSPVTKFLTFIALPSLKSLPKTLFQSATEENAIILLV